MGHMRECKWCGCRFRVEAPHSPAMYCKRSHKTAAEKRRNRIRNSLVSSCPSPEMRATPERGYAIAAAGRLHGRYMDCVCGNFHVLPAENTEPNGAPE